MASAGGFSRHAGIGIAPGRRQKLERLCRDVSRPPVATERRVMISSGYLRYALQTPYRDGTTPIVLEPLDLMARLAARVPPPRMHLTRYHGVFAPHSRVRAAVTPARRGTGAAKHAPADPGKPPTPRHVAMDWARRLKRVFGIEIGTCQRGGGRLRIIASIEQPAVIAIESFGDRLAEDLFFDRRPRETRRFPPELLRAARRKVLYLHDAAVLEDLRVPPGNRLEALKVRWKGCHSIRIIDQWRVVFRWEYGSAFEVAVIDYH